MLKKCTVLFLFSILALSICFSSTGFATTVHVSFTSGRNVEVMFYGDDEEGWAGMFTTSFSDPDFTAVGYCVDIASPLGNGGTYTVEDQISPDLYTDGIFDPGNAVYAAWLMEQFSSGLGYTGYTQHYSANREDSEAGLQLAIWDALYNSTNGGLFNQKVFSYTGDLGDGSYYNVLDYYDYYTNRLENADLSNFSAADFTIAKLLDGQDIIIRPIPEPTTMFLMGLGLLGLAGIGRKTTMAKR